MGGAAEPSDGFVKLWLEVAGTVSVIFGAGFLAGVLWMVGC